MVKETEKSVVVAVAKTPDSAIKAFLSGGFGGICLVAAGHPLDLIKVNIQTMKAPALGEKPLYAGAMDCGRQIIKKDGVKGLYRGMSAPLVGVAPIFAICFWGYDQGSKLARYGCGLQPGEKLSMAQIMFAGGFSAIPTTVVMAPGERIKCLLQIQAQSSGVASSSGEKVMYNGMADCAKKLYASGGMSSLYRGWEATLLRDIPGSIGYFGGYEGIKRVLTPRGKNPEDLNAFRTFVAGGMAGIFNWVIAIPADVIKSRYQTAPEGKYTGLVDVYKTMMKEEGPSALFKGVGPAMARAFPANAACFLGVEVSKKFLTWIGLN